MTGHRFSLLGILVILLATPLALRGVTPAAADSPDRGDDSHQQESNDGVPQPRVHIQATTFFDTRITVEHDRATNQATRFARNSSSNLINHGGPVITGPANVYLIFWGWTSDPLQSQSYINTFFGAANQSAWLRSVTQYSSATNSYSVQSITDAKVVPTRPSSNDIASEAAKFALQYGGGTNRLFIVFTPSKHSESGFATQWCGYHSSAQVVGGPTFAYASMPYQPDAGYSCGAGSVDGNANDGYSIVGGHELGEAITDVYLTAWWDRNGAENGDKCAWTGLKAVQLTPTAKYAVQPLWSNAFNAGQGGCVLSYP